MTEQDLKMFRRFATEPYLIGLDWTGFRDAEEPARRLAEHGFLGEEDHRLIVEAEPDRVATGFVGWRRTAFVPGSTFWEIGIVLLPEWRGRGIGRRAQAMLCDYLFRHTPVQRIQAGTHPENMPSRNPWSRPGSGSRG